MNVRHIDRRCAPLLFALLAAVPWAIAEPLTTDDSQTIAVVNGESITLDDLFEQLGSMHMGMAEPTDKVKKPDPSLILDRLIEVTLVVQEARNIGLDELPEFTRQVESLRMETLRQELSRRAADGITEGDPEVAERLFRDAVRELEVDSVLFTKEEAALAFAASVGADGDFRERAEQAIAAGTAKGEAGAGALKASTLRPGVVEILLQMKPGEMSPPIRLGGGYAIVKLLGVRYPEDPGARTRAREEALQIKKLARLQEQMSEWRDRYMEIDREMLDSLNYDAGAAELDKLRSDERIVARVKGGDPVTVQDLTAGVEKKFFHGIERASDEEKIKPELPGVLDRILMERVAVLEAERLGIEQSASFEGTMRRREAGMLFGSFARRVINPDVKLTTEELTGYYEEHADEFTSNEMIRLDGLAFVRREDAQAALDKLRKGADFGWMRDNAGGQADPAEFESMLRFDNRLLITLVLPQGVQDAVAGAGKNEYRFYDDPEGPAYVLVMREMIQAETRPYEAVREGISKRLFIEKQQALLDDWIEKLRAASEIEILVGDEELKRRLGLGIAVGNGGDGS